MTELDGLGLSIQQTSVPESPQAMLQASVPTKMQTQATSQLVLTVIQQLLELLENSAREIFKLHQKFVHNID